MLFRSPMIHAMVTGVGAAGAGLFIATAVKLARPLARRPAALAMIAACFLAVAIARVSLLIVVPVAAAVGMLLSERELL